MSAGRPLGRSGSKIAPITRLAARSHASRCGLPFESIELIFAMIFSLLSMSATAVAAAPTPARCSAPARGASAAAGGPEARIPVVALHPRRAALPNAAESAAVLRRCARRNLQIAHSLGSGLGSGASRLRLSGSSARLQLLAHVASVTVGHSGIRMWYALAMRGIVGPCAGSIQACPYRGN